MHVPRELFDHVEAALLQTDSRGEVVVVENHPLVGVAAVVVQRVQLAPLPRGSSHHRPLAPLRRQTVGDDVSRPLHHRFAVHELLQLLVEVADGGLLHHHVVVDRVVVVARADTRGVGTEGLNASGNDAGGGVERHVVDLVDLEHGVEGAPRGLSDEDVRLVVWRSVKTIIITRHANERRAVVQTVDLVLVVRLLGVVVGQGVPVANIAVVVGVLNLPLAQSLHGDRGRETTTRSGFPLFAII